MADLTVLDEIAAERRRQVEEEGFDADHDAAITLGHRHPPLALAAACYALAGAEYDGEEIRAFWPWDSEWWKPTTPRRDLIKAGALILAEIERLDRAAQEATDAP